MYAMNRMNAGEAALEVESEEPATEGASSRLAPLTGDQRSPCRNGRYTQPVRTADERVNIDGVELTRGVRTSSGMVLAGAGSIVRAARAGEPAIETGSGPIRLSRTEVFGDIVTSTGTIELTDCRVHGDVVRHGPAVPERERRSVQIHGGQVLGAVRADRVWLVDSTVDRLVLDGRARATAGTEARAVLTGWAVVANVQAHGPALVVNYCSRRSDMAVVGDELTVMDLSAEGRLNEDLILAAGMPAPYAALEPGDWRCLQHWLERLCGALYPAEAEPAKQWWIHVTHRARDLVQLLAHWRRTEMPALLRYMQGLDTAALERTCAALGVGLLVDEPSGADVNDLVARLQALCADQGGRWSKIRWHVARLQGARPNGHPYLRPSLGDLESVHIDASSGPDVGRFDVVPTHRASRNTLSQAYRSFHDRMSQL